MIGLEYVLNLYSIQHIELAQKLGIKKQNINMWVKGRQNIPKKYLPVLEDIFGIDRTYFSKEITEIDQLEIQKEKIKRELKPVVKKIEQHFSLGEINDLVEVPVYDEEEMNAIEWEIERRSLMARFKAAMEVVDDNPYMDTYRLIVELMEKAQHEIVLQKTVEALAHYYQVLPDWVSTGSEQDEYEDELFEFFDDNNY
ncbi:helix-turn-helix protein [Trichococcus patagoniensis]|uniref:Helix-turn-helix protein n=1 Tax=Trichococcus patagoniensis TaxID=382641 RepID=A0A2T5IL10_9LACT|nr:helix-turn-helix protein [Trichococcus patagoniensis]